MRAAEMGCGSSKRDAAGAADPANLDVAVPEGARFHVGDRVNVRYGGGRDWFPGVVARRERDGVLRIVSRGVPRSRRLEITEACQHGAQASSNDPWSLCAIPTRSLGQQLTHTQDALI